MTKAKLERTYRTPDSCAHVPLFKMTQLHVDTYFKDGYAKGELLDTLSLPSGKQAALVQISSRKGEAEASPMLLCSCELHAQVMDTDTNVSCMWMDRCRAKQALCEVYTKKARQEYASVVWKDNNSKENAAKKKEKNSFFPMKLFHFNTALLSHLLQPFLKS